MSSTADKLRDLGVTKESHKFSDPIIYFNKHKFYFLACVIWTMTSMIDVLSFSQIGSTARRNGP
jgi:hypothetical protein